MKKPLAVQTRGFQKMDGVTSTVPKQHRGLLVRDCYAHAVQVRIAPNETELQAIGSQVCSRWLVLFLGVASNKPLCQANIWRFGTWKISLKKKFPKSRTACPLNKWRGISAFQRPVSGVGSVLVGCRICERLRAGLVMSCGRRSRLFRFNK